MTVFTHLHVHSYYSLLDGTASPKELIQQARKLKFKHLALTDHQALHGAIEFYRLAKEEGIHPIIGAEITLPDESKLVLLVKDQNGYRNLCQLLSMGHLRAGHLKFKFDLKEIFRYRNGLVALSGGQQGKLWQFARAREFEAAGRYCRQLKTVFQGDFYIELQQFVPNDFLINIRLRDLAVQQNIPLLATNDVHFTAAEDWPVRRALHAIDQNTLIEKITTAGSPSQYLKSAEEMK